MIAGLENVLYEFFSGREGIAAVYLFGSVARGTERPDSDVDIGVLYVQEPPRTLLGQPFDLEADLSALLGRPVQIVVLNRAPVDLIHRVLRDGIIILEPDVSRRIAFEVRSRNMYWDLKPILDEYRKARA